MRTIYCSKIWLSDIDRIIDAFPELSDLNGRTVLITGASGLIGSAIADLFIRYNETRGGQIGIIAAGRHKEKIIDRFAPYSERDYFHYVYYNAAGKTGENTLTDIADYVIHGAGIAYPGKIIEKPVETMIGCAFGTYQILRYACQYNISRLLFISSSEVYGQIDGIHPYTHNDYGYIDLLNVRNSYSVSKRMAETLCISYCDEYGLDVVIARPGHIYGPTASRLDNRVSSEWAYEAAMGKTIIMKSDGCQIRSYCYCLDCASAILKVMLSGTKAHVYNIADPDSNISIAQMAQHYADSAGVDLVRKLATVEEVKSFNPMQNSSLDSSELRELGWKASFSANEGLGHTIKIIRDRITN